MPYQISSKARKRENARDDTSWSESTDSQDDEETSDASEDDYAKRLTKKLDSQIARTYQLLKTKDPSIYDQQTQFYSEEEEDSDSSMEPLSYDDDNKPVALTYEKKIDVDSMKDASNKAHSRVTLNKPSNNISLYDPEQVRLKQEISNIADSLPQGTTDEFLTRKESSQDKDTLEEEHWMRTIQEAERNQTAEEYLLHSYLEKEKPDEAERFLRDYILNDGWIKNIHEAPTSNSVIHNIEIDEQDAEFVEKQEDFEAAYNFRFEEPNSTEIVSYGRNISSSSRPKENKRKKKRDRREMRKKEKKQNKWKEWDPLKKEKREKILCRIKQVLEVCEKQGVSYFSWIEQDDDLDINQHKQKVKAILDEQDESWLKTYLESESSAPRKTSEGLEGYREKILEIDRLIDEYFELELEDVVDDAPIRFRYRPVEPETFGLETTDILQMDETELNRLVPLNYVTSYVQPKGLSRIRKRVKWIKKHNSLLSNNNKTTDRKKRRIKNDESSSRGHTSNETKESYKGLQLSIERMKAYGLRSVE
ncbi:Protein KRI1 [Galdieria sulphuraria]|uniref:Kri1-like C-terminal domain-containing protein n=1 Tax=Galdieria sulphuraria TaxID=130081 RepID=M2XUY5_GALSU|nr:uncharacterized protein Gasu_50440 [Galdieria sulphuraria]EME27453.1 hypothetical protein Gasu_50440 [Galdieria sulphuraria]GJD09289.1 Protein KRI1 [Galdieria sulphuraria]|eukprot:XP_005703973.1 hypothetical protein Gasu_50440 [Galdieria sulphuraria]